MDRINHKIGYVKKELMLLKPFIKEPWKEFTLAEIKNLANNKSHHYVYDSLKRFSELGVINIVKRGNTALYSVNIETKDYGIFTILEFLIKTEREDIPLDIIYKITNKIKPSFFTLLITGSYAERKQKKTSDLDIALIIPNSEQKKKYEIALKEGELNIPEIHGYVFTEEEFYLMLTNKEFNYGKECTRKHIIIYGSEIYYKILLGAMQNGFKG